MTMAQHHNARTKEQRGAARCIVCNEDTPGVIGSDAVAHVGNLALSGWQLTCPACVEAKNDAERARDDGFKYGLLPTDGDNLERAAMQLHHEHCQRLTADLGLRTPTPAWSAIAEATRDIFRAAARPPQFAPFQSAGAVAGAESERAAKAE
jgi:hypothetical protein